MKKFFIKWFKVLVDKIKALITQCTIFLIKKLSHFELILNRNTIVPNPNGYEDLTPTSNGDEDRKYSAALEWALKNRNIKNVALTGAYGSGKSSIIRTFEKEHRGYRYLNISLASFTDTSEQIDPSREYDKREVNIDRLIELSILQQMFYHVKHKRIPDSRFKRIKSIGKTGVFAKSLVLIVWISAILLFFKPKFIQKTAIWDQLDLSNPITTYVLLSIIIIGIGIIISKSVRVANNSKLNKLNVQSGEIEISNEIDSSILNKHLDEILYFFEVTKYNVVIIEDLDRFNNTEIFTKLRELNILINSSRQINRRVVFIYAIKDDMFHDKNRTKFFDFIIPIIPVINTSNSGAMLHKMLTKTNLDEKTGNKHSLSTTFIDDVSMYIDDMRLLKNICNEFIVYKEKLSSKLHPDNLLAMIIYKNIFPSDFVNLHNNEGKVYKIFDDKYTHVRGRIADIDSKIIELKEEIKNIENQKLTSLNELRSVYINALREKIPDAISIILDKDEYNFIDLKDEENFELLTECDDIIYKYHHLIYSHTDKRERTVDSSISFASLEKYVNSSIGYNRREQLIKDKENGKIESLKKRIEELNKEKNDIRSWSIQQIAEKIDISNSFEEIKNDKLIVYLIRNGYINENYYDYISYFHEGLITKDDREFLFSVKNHDPLPHDFKLNKIENLIKKLHPKEFESKSILNCSLVDFLLPRQKDYNEQWKTISDQLRNKNKVAIEFIDTFIEKGLNVDLFIISMCQQWIGFWDFIILESGYSDDKKDKYLKLVIEYVDIDTIKIQNTNRNISNYLSFKKDAISVFSNEPKIEKVLATLDIKFESLIKPESDNNLLDFIYENDLYRINKEMITLFIEAKSTSDTVNLNNANYTTIKTSGCTQLITYIDNNLDEYISNVFLMIPENTEESENFVTELLHKEEEILEIGKRLEIVEMQNCLISKLSILEEMEFSLLERIVQKSKMAATWENVITYYKLKENVIDDILVSYLNQEANYKELAKTKLDKENKVATELAKAFILNEKISDNSFEYLLRCYAYVYPELNFENLSNKKVDLMIKYGYLQLSIDRFNFLKDNFDKHIDLLEKYPQKFIEAQTGYTLDGAEILALLNSSEFNQQQKVSIIQNTDSSIIVENEELSNVISNILAECQCIKLDFDVFENLIRFGNQMVNKLKLIYNYIDSLDDAEIRTLLSLLTWPYSDVAQKGKKPTLEKSELILKILNKLMDRGLISSFKEKDGKYKVYSKKV